MSWSTTIETGSGAMRCHPLTPDRFDDMDSVFGEQAVTRRCFCMHWRRPDGGYTDDRPNRERFRDIAMDGPPPGLLGYLGEEAAGWVQVGPRNDFPTIRRSHLLRPVDEVETWSVNCFVVRKSHRRSGVGRGLLAAAIEYARSNGATILEAYPVDGERQSVVDYFTGTLGMFDKEGFVEIVRRNDTRPIVRLEM